MTRLAITGYAGIGAAGLRRDALAEVITAGGREPAAVQGLYEEALPTPQGHAYTDFNVREHLGRKGTSFYDRATALAVVAVGAALGDAGIDIDDDNRARVGVALGTTVGSFKSTSDYSMETLVQPKPYLVNPVLFPNTVMNCAAGQAAIRYGLRGVNATVTGGPMAFLNALRYAQNAIGQGFADTMLVGAVEEFTPHRAWMSAISTPGSVAGEGTAVFVVTGSSAEPLTEPLAEVLAVATGFGPQGRAEAAVAGCVRRALLKAGVAGSEIATVIADSAVDDAAIGVAARAERLRPTMLFGDCGAATPALALAGVLELHRAEPARHGRVSLFVCRSGEGAVGAAVVRGWGGGGPDRG
jgi:3-oxoacyl-[acyl-carrier-protein] synthase II